jgi:flagellar hook-basal body complex protein FliE
MSALPVEAVAALATSLPEASRAAPVAGPGSFARLLLDGVDQVNQKVVDADAMAKAFALDDSIPLHQVTFALEQARLSVELMMQVRARLVEGYQEMLRMQL